MTEDTLIDTIYKRPEDDAARLAFAEWLDENGQPDRATFIRTQIELARLDSSTQEHDDAITRSVKAFALAKPEWWASLSNIEQSSSRGMFRFRVGHTRSSRSPKAAKRLGAVRWLETAHQAGWLCDLSVWFDEANLDVVESWGSSASSLPLHAEFAPITQLDEPGVERVLALPQLRSLETSVARMYPVPEEGVASYKWKNKRAYIPAVAQAQHLEALHIQVVSPSHEPEHIDQILDEVVKLPNLRRLQLSDSGPTSTTVDHQLLRLTESKSLVRLKLSGTHNITEDALAEFRNARPTVDLIAPHRQ